MFLIGIRKHNAVIYIYDKILVDYILKDLRNGLYHSGINIAVALLYNAITIIT